MEQPRPLQAISDHDLLDRLTELTRDSRHTEADLVAHMAEVDERKLYASNACASMFSYCTEILHFSEAEAYLRIVAARASRRHPVLLTLLVVLAKASYRSKRQIQELVAELSPRPDAQALIRKLPQRHREEGPPSLPLVDPHRARESSLSEPVPRTDDRLHPDEVLAGSAHVATVPRPVIEPLAPARYKVQFTATAALHDKLQRLQALMRSQVPDGDLSTIIEQAVTEKLERLEARRFGLTKAPRKTLAESDTSAASRYIPAPIRRFVAERDGMRCRYVDEQGRRCSQRHRLDFHHRHPFGFGGDHRPAGVQLLCPRHNQLLAEHDYGSNAMARHRRVKGTASCNRAPTAAV